MQLKLKSIGDIDRLIARIGYFDRPEASSFELPHDLDETQSKRLSRRLTFGVSDCGCAPASFAMIATIFLSCWYLQAPLWALSWREIGSVIALSFILGIGVKLVALLYSYKRLHSDLRDLKMHISNSL